MENLITNKDNDGLQAPSNEELVETSGGCKGWVLLFGLAGIARYIGWHDADKGVHE